MVRHPETEQNEKEDKIIRDEWTSLYTTGSIAHEQQHLGSRDQNHLHSTCKQAPVHQHQLQPQILFHSVILYFLFINV